MRRIQRQAETFAYRTAMADTAQWHPQIQRESRLGEQSMPTWGTYHITLADPASTTGRRIGELKYSLSPAAPRYKRNHDELYIDSLFVLPDHRGQGIAQALVERASQDHPNHRVNPGYTTPEGHGITERLRQTLDPNGEKLITNYEPYPLDPQDTDEYNEETLSRLLAAARRALTAAALVVDPPTLECKHRTPCPPGACPQRDIAADPDFYADFPDPADKEREFQDLYRLQSDDAPTPTAPPPPPPNQPARAILTEFLQQHAQPSQKTILSPCADCQGKGSLVRDTTGEGGSFYKKRYLERNPGATDAEIVQVFGEPPRVQCPACEGGGAVVNPDVAAKMLPWAQRLEDALYGEFMEWWPQSEASQIRKPETSGTKWEDHPKEPVTHWLNVEDFFKERYPEAATGSTFGGENAQFLLEEHLKADKLGRPQPSSDWLEAHGYVGRGNAVTQAMLTLHNRFNKRPWRDAEDRRRYYELMLRHVGPDAVKRPKVASTLSADLINKLQSEFDEWHGGDRVFREHHGRPGFGIGDWRNVEKFLKERYPAAHRGFDMGLEEARPLLRGEPNIVAKDFPTWYETHPRNLADDKPYETGPDAVAQHGYDPKEIAAGMVLLHNRRNTESVFGTHRTRDNELAADVDFLNDIFQKRTKMQRNYEQRQTVTAAKADGFTEPIEQLKSRLHGEFTDWVTPLVNMTEWPEGGRWAPKPAELVGEWPYVERFLKAKYPAAHQGFDMGREEARPGVNKRVNNPYPTGPEAVAQYGYDPREIAAGMLLLHIPEGTRHERVPKNVLVDIFNKRMQMQRTVNA